MPVIFNFLTRFLYLFLFVIIDDIDNGLITYTLSEGVTDTDDSFEFSVMDSKPNTVTGQTFNIRWSYVEFGLLNITATEDQQIIEIPVMRRGSTNGVRGHVIWV